MTVAWQPRPLKNRKDAIHAEAKKWAQPISMKQVSIEPSSLGNHAALFGAGLLALQNKRAE